MTVEIIKPGKVPAVITKKYKVECPHCGAIFKFSDEDIRFGWGSGKFDAVFCPTCNFWCTNYEQIKDLSESIRRIKQTVEWFPGLLLGLDRQVGKTMAILEMIKERHDGAAFLFSPSGYLSRLAMVANDNKYPDQYGPARFIFLAENARGSNWPIYVDEWWMLSEKQQKEVMATGRVVCRLGTPNV